MTSTQPGQPMPELQLGANDDLPATQVSALQTPTPNTIEVPLSAGEDNRYDLPQFLYHQLMFIDSIAWSTTDPKGKLLFHLPLCPQNFTPTVAYITRLFYAWGGSFEINVKILSTAFHAGGIVVVYFPPDCDPLQNSSPHQYTVFPWKFMEAKSTCFQPFVCNDIRNVKFHKMFLKDGKIDPDSIGGRLCVFVDSPLVTSSTGVNKIFIEMWGKLMPDFRVGHMLPVQNNNVAPILFPDEILSSLEFAPNRQVVGSSCPFIIRKITIQKGTLREISSGLYNCCDISGSPLSNHDKGKFPYSPTTPQTVRVQSVNGMQVKGINVTPQWWGEALGVLVQVANAWSLAEFNTSGNSDVTMVLFSSGVPSNVESDVALNYQDTTPANWNENSIRLLNANESFVTFNSDKNFSIQPWSLTEMLATKKYANLIPVDMAALFQLSDYTSKTPLTYLKLYRSGIMTAPITQENIDFPISNGYLIKFQEFVPEISDFPSNDAQKAQLAMHRMHLDQQKFRRDLAKLNTSLLAISKLSSTSAQTKQN